MTRMQVVAASDPMWSRTEGSAGVVRETVMPRSGSTAPTSRSTRSGGVASGFSCSRPGRRRRVVSRTVAVSRASGRSGPTLTTVRLRSNRRSNALTPAPVASRASSSARECSSRTDAAFVEPDDACRLGIGSGGGCWAPDAVVAPPAPCGRRAGRSGETGHDGGEKAWDVEPVASVGVGEERGAAVGVQLGPDAQLVVLGPAEQPLQRGAGDDELVRTASDALVSGERHHPDAVGCRGRRQEERASLKILDAEDLDLVYETVDRGVGKQQLVAGHAARP